MTSDGSHNSIRIRLLSLGGLLVTTSMILLGAVWPSYYTIVAIPVIPAPFAFGALIYQPGLASKWPKMCIYLAACVAVAAFSWLTEFIWLSSR
jgi:hypothetical protein